MKQVTAKEAKNQFGQFLDWAQSEPIRVTKRGRSVGVLMSEEQFQRLRGTAWEQLQAPMNAMRLEAESKGTRAMSATQVVDCFYDRISWVSHQPQTSEFRSA